MYDPSMRVLTVLELLQVHERLTGPELARKLEVSARTVQRYVARLQDLGIPVESSRGVGGSYRLSPGFRLPPLMFNNDEAFALSLGLRALGHLGLDALVSGALSAGLKLERVLPKDIAERVRDVEDAVTLDPMPWVIPTDPDVLQGAAMAIRSSRRVMFSYQNHAGEASRREVSPYGVLHHDGRWYVVGHCHLRDSVRIFRLDRIREPSVLEQTFIRPEGFDAKAYLYTHMPFVQEVHPIEVWLDCPLEEVRKKLPYSRVQLEALRGGTRLTCTRDLLEPFATMLLGLGVALKVVGPPQLKEVFLSLAARANAAVHSP
jgi:predicted DNA-binding transcriptional regulator YafY